MTARLRIHDQVLSDAELSDCIEDAFLVTPASKSDLLDAALRCDARPVVFLALNYLPERDFGSLHDVWSCLTGPPSGSVHTSSPPTVPRDQADYAGPDGDR
jgi:hypothetical protein